MIRYKSLGGFDIPEKLSYNDFEDLILTTPNTQKHMLGTSFDGHDIHGLSVGDLNKPMILIFNQHGAHEWRTPYWIRKFIDIVANKSHLIYRNKFVEMQTDFCIMAIPTINPDGYINDTRTNGNNVDLNRNYDLNWEGFETEHSGTKGSAPFSEPETQIIKSIVEQYKPSLFIDCHTWGGGDRPTYETASHNKHEVLFSDTIKSFNLAGMVNEPFRWAKDDFRPKGTAWASKQLSMSGQPIMSVAIESAELTSVFDQTKEGMDMLMVLCLNAMNYYKTHNLILSQ